MIPRIILSVCVILLCSGHNGFAQGYLFIIGGGERTDHMMEKFVKLAGGKEGKVVIFPTASAEPERTGQFLAEEFINRGVGSVSYIVCTRETADTEENFKKMEGATGVFFSGGDQRRHVEALGHTELLQLVKEVYRNGGVIGGTSAGAAIMSRLMITGDEALADDVGEPFSIIRKGNIVTSDGFGFLDSVIIDQHFVRRKRHNRLMSLVLEHPHLVGIGIDESTAIIVSPDDTFHVVGDYSVIVYDARQATDISADERGNLTGRNITVHVLGHGDVYQLGMNGKNRR